MNDCIVVLNCGSSSIKFALFDATLDPLPRAPMWNGKVEGSALNTPRRQRLARRHRRWSLTVYSRITPRSCTFASVSSKGWKAAG